MVLRGAIKTPPAPEILWWGADLIWTWQQMGATYTLPHLFG